MTFFQPRLSYIYLLINVLYSNPFILFSSFSPDYQNMGYSSSGYDQSQHEPNETPVYPASDYQPPPEQQTPVYQQPPPSYQPPPYEDATAQQQTPAQYPAPSPQVYISSLYFSFTTFFVKFVSFLQNKKFKIYTKCLIN